MPLPLWGIVCSVPYNVICIWAILCMVPIRRPWLFALLWQIVCLPIFFIPAESAYGWLRTVLSSVLWLSLALLFVKRRSLRVVFAAVLISLLSVVTEVLATMLTILLLGKYVDTALVVNEPRSMLMVQIIFWSIFALLCWVLVYIWRRGIRPQDEPYLRRFILVPLSQHFLVIFSAVLSLFRRVPLGSYLLLGVMALCCVLPTSCCFTGCGITPTSSWPGSRRSCWRSSFGSSWPTTTAWWHTSKRPPGCGMSCAISCKLLCPDGARRI